MSQINRIMFVLQLVSALKDALDDKKVSLDEWDKLDQLVREYLAE